MSAIHWSQNILQLRALRKDLNNKKKKNLMSTDHRLSTVNNGFHIFISFSSSQSPSRGQVSSIHRNYMDQKMAREAATFSWNFKLTDQVWYFRVHLRKSHSWWVDHSVHVSDRGPWQWKIFQNTFRRWMLSLYSLECQAIYLKRHCMQLIISQECEVREKGVGMQ